MAKDLEKLRRNKTKVREELQTALRCEFNSQSIHVSIGISMRADHDYAIRIFDRTTPNEPPSEDVVRFARKKMETIAPEGKHDVIRTVTPKARKLVP